MRNSLSLPPYFQELRGERSGVFGEPRSVVMEKNVTQDQGQEKHTLHILGREYTILSKLDEATFTRISGIVKEQINTLPAGAKQDEKMLLACLQLAYTLDKISRNCSTFLENDE